MKTIFINIVWLFLLSSVFIGCKREDAYKDFVKDGSITYPGKPLELKAQAGKNRAKLTWVVLDTKVTKFVVYWNNKQDSLVVAAKSSGESADTLNVIVNNLPESDYLFEVYSFDAKGNRSIKEEAQAKVYGDVYIQSLLNRSLKSSSSLSGIANLIWYGAEQTEAGVEVNYTDNTGKFRKVMVTKTDTLTTLTDYKNGTQFSYRTLFLPDSSAFDTVASAFITPPAPKIIYPQLDKSKFVEYDLPTDIGSAWGWTMPYLWDNNLAEGRGFHTPEAPFPYQFTFDLGVTTELHEMKTWQRQLTYYNNGNPRKWEVWGSTNPATDGSYTGWTKLLNCESIKPSGMASGYTSGDEAYAKAGESYIFPDNSPPVRYIRFKIFQNWENKNPGATHIMEVSFWSK